MHAIFNLIAGLVAGIGIPINILWLFVFYQSMYFDNEGNVSSIFKPSNSDKLLFAQTCGQLLSCIIQSTFNFWMFAIDSIQSDNNTTSAINTLFAAHVWFSYVSSITILMVIARARYIVIGGKHHKYNISINKQIILCFTVAFILALSVALTCNNDLQPSHIWCMSTYYVNNPSNTTFTIIDTVIFGVIGIGIMYYYHGIVQHLKKNLQSMENSKQSTLMLVIKEFRKTKNTVTYSGIITTILYYASFLPLATMIWYEYPTQTPVRPIFDFLAWISAVLFAAVCNGLVAVVICKRYRDSYMMIQKRCVKWICFCGSYLKQTNMEKSMNRIVAGSTSTTPATTTRFSTATTTRKPLDTPTSIRDTPQSNGKVTPVPVSYNATPIETDEEGRDKIEIVTNEHVSGFPDICLELDDNPSVSTRL